MTSIDDPFEDRHAASDAEENAKTAESQDHPASDNGSGAQELADMSAQPDVMSSEGDAETGEQSLLDRIEELQDQLLRRSAEMENMRKRMQRERIQLFEQARSAAIEAFLPVNDDLLRTLDALRSAQADNTFLDGIQMVSDKFETILKSHGVEAISDVDVPFDVNLHEALMRQKAPNPDTASNTVLQVLENGYRLGEKVIRHAKVIVSE